MTNNNIVPQNDGDSLKAVFDSSVIKTLTGGIPQWVVWRKEEVDGKSKKVPYISESRKVDTTKPYQCLNYQAAIFIHTSKPDVFDGIGLVLDGKILGVDLDSCLRDGVITDPVVAEFVEAAKTYTDISPSGTGLHLYFKLTESLELQRNRLSSAQSTAHYEFYTENRYLTFSCNPFGTYGFHGVRTISPEEAVELLEILGYSPDGGSESSEELDLTVSSSTPDLEAIKQAMFNSSSSPEIKNLYSGDTSAYTDDISRAEAALCGHLAYWTNGDRDAMRELWLDSDLAQRTKTQERSDYVERTLDLALASHHPGSSGDSVTLSESTSKQNELEEMISDLTMAEMDVEDLIKLETKLEWDVDQLIPSSTLNMIAAPSHQGKTFIALHIAVCMAYQLPVFGHFKVDKQKNVLIFNEEDVAEDLKNRMSSLLPQEREPGGKIKIYTNTDKLISPMWIEGVMERVRANNAGMVIIDSLAEMTDINENDNQEARKIMRCLRRLWQNGVTVILLHHNKKGQGQGGINESAMDMIRGASSIPASLHGCLGVRALNENEFRISQLKLKASGRKVKPFTVRKVSMVTLDNTFKDTFEYLGEHDPDSTVAEALGGIILKLCQESAHFYFTRKTLVEMGLAHRAEDKKLRNALDRLVKQGLLNTARYKELDDVHKQSIQGSGSYQHNTTVYWPSETLTKQGGQSEMNEDPADKEIPF